MALILQAPYSFFMLNLFFSVNDKRSQSYMRHISDRNNSKSNIMTWRSALNVAYQDSWATLWQSFAGRLYSQLASLESQCSWNGGAPDWLTV